MSTKLPPLPKVGERRLIKLIEFLEKLPRKKFNFRNLVTKADRRHTCATVACAVGWLPAVFPRHAHWADLEGVDGENRSIGLDEGFEIADALFKMEGATATHLFNPSKQQYLHTELPTCDSDATPKQVAKMLRKYLALTKEAA